MCFLLISFSSLRRERERDIKAEQAIKESRAERQRGLLHFRFVFVAAFGLADAVLPLPVQELLQLLLLPAWRVFHMSDPTAARERSEGHTHFSHISLSFFS